MIDGIVPAPVQTPSAWLFGEGFGLQVWSVQGDVRVWASVLIGEYPPVILINRRIAHTEHEHAALDWAMAQIASGQTGFFALWAP